VYLILLSAYKVFSFRWMCW